MYGNDPEVITDRCVLPAVPGYCIQWSDHHRFSGYGTAGCLYLLFCTCSGCLLSDSQHTGRHESCEILQRNDAGDHVCIFQCIFCGNSADQLKLYREAWCKTWDRFLRSSAGSNYQHGWYCYLSGRMCDFYRILLWYSADSAADADHCPDRNFGFHRNRRCTGSRYGYAGNGTDLCWTSNRWYRAGSRCWPYLRYGSDNR